MEAINKHNYEAYFLDWSEGNLSEQGEKELTRFLADNPSLKEELDNFEEIKLSPPEIIFENKQDLIRKTQAQHFEITEFEYLCAATLENDITDEEKIQLKSDLQDSNKKKDFTIFGKTKLKADKSIVYFAKSDLYKHSIVLNYKTVLSVVSAAAILLFFIFKGDIFTGNITGNSKLELADVQQTNKLIKPIPRQLKTTLYDKTATKQGQTLVTHNQTIKNSTNNVLAFEDTEPRNTPDLYKELTVPIPEIKNGALISNIHNRILLSANSIPAKEKSIKHKLNKKDQFWKYAEKGVNMWNRLTKDDIELKNEYAENGSVNEVNFITSNFQFRKTYNKNNLNN